MNEIEVRPGGIIRADKTWSNVGSAGNRDVIAMYGTGTNLENFVMEFGGVAVDQYCAAGGQVTTPVDCQVPLDAALGLKDVLVGLGKYDPVIPAMAFDDYDIIPNAIEVAGGPIPPVALSAAPNTPRVQTSHPIVLSAAPNTPGVQPSPPVALSAAPNTPGVYASIS